MDYDMRRVGKYLDNEINTYQKLYGEEVNKKESLHGKYFDDKKLIRYSHYLQCLSKVNKDLHYPSSFERFNIIQEILIKNREMQYDTKFIFLDDSEKTISYDSCIDCQDGYLLIFDKDYFEKDKTLKPPIDIAISLMNVKEVCTLK